MANNTPLGGKPIASTDGRSTQTGERKWNTLNNAYILPADEEEFSRLDTQHLAFKIGLGGLYPFPEVVEPILLSSEGGPKRILDVGCGSGAWILDMAKQYPHVSILGLDLAPSNQDPSKLPPNVVFKMQNVNGDMSEYYDQFDLIHMRFLGPFVDTDKTYIELERCLKPGGVFITIDITGKAIEAETRNKEIAKVRKIEGDDDVSGLSEEGSWLRRITWELRGAVTAAGIDMDQYATYKEQGFWDHPLLDDAAQSWLRMPVGPWATAENAEETQVLQKAGEFMRKSISSVHRAWHTAIRRAGIPQGTLDEWSKNLQEELDTLSFHYSYIFYISCARRRTGKGLPAPPLPALSTSLAPEDAQRIVKGFKYPWYRTFDSAEEAATARMKEQLPSEELGTSAVMRVLRAKGEQ